MNDQRSALRVRTGLVGAGLVALSLYACETKVIPHAGGDGPPEKSSGGRGGPGGKGGSTGGKGENIGGTGSGGGAEPSSGGRGGDAGESGTTGEGGAGALAGVGGAAGRGGGGGAGGMGKAGGAGKAGSSGGVPASVCGDMMLEGDEECDDGNRKNGDGCTSLCTKACELCEVAECSELLDTGSELVTRMEACFSGFGDQDVSMGGPAPNLPKSELCQRTISCIRESNCAVASPPDAVLLGECYCGSTPQDDCFSGAQPPSGPCVEEFEWAAESTTPAVILAQRIGSPIYALGRASLLAQCDAQFCTEECLGGRTLSGMGGMGGMSGSAGNGGAGAVSGAGGTSGAAGTGSSGAGAGAGAGTGGAGSGGQGPGCGDLSVGVGEDCDPPSEDNLCDDDCERLVPDACHTCETTVDLDGDLLADCSAYAAPDAGCEAALLVGNASTAGGAPPNTPKRLLCYQAYECIRESGCSEGQTGVTGCYCGSTNPTDCFLGAAPPNGVCKALIEQGLESTIPSVIVGQRFGDPNYAAGMALLRAACDRVTCDLECNQ